ncbi:MAG: Ig domain-containing protein, partial [Nitrososphaerales archaeon]
PSGTALTVNESWNPREVLSAKAIIGVGSGGDITLLNARGKTDVVVDVDGYFTDAGGELFNTLPIPLRLVDTRTGPQLGAAGPNTIFTVLGINETNGEIPANAAAVALNITDIANGPNYLEVVSPSQIIPAAADVNYTSGDTSSTLSNAAYAILFSPLDLLIYNAVSSANIVVDAFGYFAPSNPSVPRLLVSTPTTDVPEATEGTAYATSLSVSGGSAPYTWALDGGSFPPGLVLDPLSGDISGTPSTPGLYFFTVEVSDSTTPVPQVATAPLEFVVTRASG